jgi:hypothetical protein
LLGDRRRTRCRCHTSRQRRERGVGRRPVTVPPTATKSWSCGTPPPKVSPSRNVCAVDQVCRKRPEIRIGPPRRDRPLPRRSDVGDQPAVTYGHDHLGCSLVVDRLRYGSSPPSGSSNPPSQPVNSRTATTMATIHFVVRIVGRLGASQATIRFCERRDSHSPRPLHAMAVRCYWFVSTAVSDAVVTCCRLSNRCGWSTLGESDSASRGDG